MRYNVGDIVYVELPAGDGKTKVRPAAVAGTYHDAIEFVFLYAITSQYDEYNIYHNIYRHPISFWQSAGLVKKSYIKVGEIFTVGAEFISDIGGHLIDEDYENFLSVIDYSRII
ncbi:type II toxin-antitoxin system PemK/MazF family toxin [Paenibacillus pabuli]|uniref:type II toxin-antitoxin system PemK/MazF family toxin n=1 Tax=Paenibacillus pabuli TaxID=1472 RepID=UPI003242E4A8